MHERKQILVADDEPNLRKVLSAQLTKDGYDILLAEDGEAAIEMLESNHVDVVVSDLRMPKQDGMAVLKWAVEHRPDVPVVLITAHGTIDNAVEALKMGAFDYITKPFDRTELKNTIQKAIRSQRKNAVNASKESIEDADFQWIGSESNKANMFQEVLRVASKEEPILILGETGTGKEALARAIHQHSKRSGSPYIRLNCGAVPKDLIEGELFGYEQGAMPGAVTAKPGRFELADQGTLYLDGIAEIPTALQSRVLRVLKEKSLVRMGSPQEIKVDVRLIATAKDEQVLSQSNKGFLPELYKHFVLEPIWVKPLRERREDMPYYIEHIQKQSAAKLNKEHVPLSDAVMDALLGYSWPGNIRELENAMERAMLLSDDGELKLAYFPAEVAGTTTLLNAALDLPDSGLEGFTGGLKEAVKEAARRLEKELIQKALLHTEGNVTKAAKLLRISRKGLQLKMKEFDLREQAEE